MHLSVRHSQTLDESNAPVNPAQSPADMLVLSFTDSDLACMAAAYAHTPTLRLTSLAPLKHPLSVDLYLEQVAAQAKVILVRLLGGYEWWRYGAEELGKFAREKNIALIMVSGDNRSDARLTELSTVSPGVVAAIEQCLSQGGAENVKHVLNCMAALAEGKIIAPTPITLPNGARYKTESAKNPAGTALILFYRAHTLAADTAPIDALLQALAERGLAARAFMVTSLKDKASLAALHEETVAHRPDIILDATAFSAGDNTAHPLANLGVPILQCALANSAREAWEASQRGLGASDLAMHVVLPETDGRIFTRAISFKAEAEKNPALEFARVSHQPEKDRIAHVADTAAAWVKLSKTQEKRLALVLSDYPGRSGRCAYAVGLDAPQSALNILQLLQAKNLPTTGNALIEALQTRQETYPAEKYLTRFHALPEKNRQDIINAWGAPQEDATYQGGAFHLRIAQFGNIAAALQPDRGSALDRKASYHDPLLPPRHGYLAFYWWLRDVMQIDAMIHLGTHGNLEWLPGKSVALSSACWPEIALGATPVVYPYIVSDPGEAAQAKRRIGAVTLGHLPPPLTSVEMSPALAELEQLADEYGSADGLDARRMKLLQQEIIHRARRSGLPGDSDDALMTSLETHLCDIKEQRVRDGLHIFGQNAPLEIENLLATLAGKFVAPGPGGSPSRGRMDVLPTGRNLIAIDPRTMPTRTSAAIGKRAGEEFVRRYVQDHGDWPKSVVIDVWGSATLRNGGDEIAQALWLMGATPTWDESTSRVTGFTLLPDAELPWPRIDVSLRISGLFRDMFPHLIALFDDAVRALGKDWRIFGAAPGAYGTGLSDRLDAGNWQKRSELGQTYIESSSFAYGRDADGAHAPQALKDRITEADALVHVQDQRDIDLLDGTDFAEAEGGFAAAAEALGNTPSLYHLDTSQPQHIKARTLAEEISLVLHSRALSPQWIAGQMRHGYAGAAALADVADQLFAFAATTDTVPSAQFDAVFDAYLFDEKVRAFLEKENPDALAAIANRLDEAMRRGLWKPLRNSTTPLLDSLRGRKAAA